MAATHKYILTCSYYHIKNIKRERERTCTPAICWSHKEVLGGRCERHLTKSSFKLTFCPLDFVTTLMFIRHKEVVLRSFLKRSMQLLRDIGVVKWFLVFLITCIICIRGDLDQTFDMVMRVCWFWFFEKKSLKRLSSF